MLSWLLGFVICFALVGFVVGALQRSIRASNGNLPPDRDDIAYRPYTTEFDVVCTGAELADVIAGSPNNVASSRKADRRANEERDSACIASHRAALSEIAEVQLNKLDDWAIVVLIDQSGSLADQTAEIAGGVGAAVKKLEAAGANVMVAGFTTVGWHGGQSRRKWSKQGRPAYPGRLCDLLHIVYSPFDEPFAKNDLNPLFESGALFENVDGEALRWAAGELKSASSTQRAIVVISDGAPVDDSSLMENGPAFLERDILSAISEVEGDQAIELGAVGIGFEVSRYYSHSTTAETVDALSGRILTIVSELVAKASAEAQPQPPR